ncbi:TonB-dependent receptor [Compostibacter hankyongensis]|uniref:TonB-dependent receptor n=1 Tax=Compostibacter hankyongensis TaxID=1007089 RepID=A0ABP8FLP8_9BACT
MIIPSALLAQHAGVRGLVRDKLTGLPMRYVSIALYRTGDSSLVNGTITDSTGKFELGRLKAGDFYLTVQFVGYRQKTIPSFVLSESRNTDLGDITIIPDQRMLDELKVSGKKVENYNKIDKQVYEAGQFEAAKGGSALDVLKNLPSVSVNGEGRIMMRGSTGFLVLINGKPVLTDAQSALSQLPANAVADIELITAPSAKYDPDGKSGIINIITKKGAADGLTFVANVQGGLPSTTDYGNLKKPVRFGGDAAFNYKKGKWNIAAGADYTRNDVEGYRVGDVYTINSTKGYTTHFPSEGERSFDKYNYAGRVSIGFTPDAGNAFSLGFSTSKKFQARLADIFYKNTKTRTGADTPFQKSPYYNSNLQTKEGTFTLGSLDYTHTFTNRSTLSASVLYEWDNLYGDTKNRNLKNAKPGADTIQYVFNPYKKPIHGYRAKLDYALPIGKGKLESGYQFRYDTEDGEFGYQVTPAPVPPDPERFAGTVQSKNQINAAYSQYSGQAGQLEYVGGLRYEYAARTVRLSYDPAPHHLYLSNLFPSASLLYTLGRGWKAKAGYSRRIQRTDNYQLNPIPEREHSETLEQGDPDLLPEFVDLWEAGIIKSFSLGSFFATLYHQDIKNPIQRVNSVYADTILNRVYTNAERARLTGIELETDIRITKWWDLYAGANIYQYKIRGDLKILDETFDVKNSDWVYAVNANTNFQLGPTWSIQGNVNYLSTRPTAQGKDSRFLSPNTSVKKTFMDGKIAVMLQWQNMDMGFLGSNEQRITTSGPDFYTTTNYIYETDVFMINISFNLNKLGSKVQLPKSEFGEKEF